MASHMEKEINNDVVIDDDVSSSSEEDLQWDDWEAENDDVTGVDDGEFSSKLICLFCDSLHDSCVSLFEHCSSVHSFDFDGLKKAFGLDFYGGFKLINYVRSQVADNKCWNCDITCESNQALLNHLHEKFTFEKNNLPWNNDKFLQPFKQEDALLYSFAEEDEIIDDDEILKLDGKELLRELSSFEKVSLEDQGLNGNGGASINGGNEIPPLNGVESLEEKSEMNGQHKTKQMGCSDVKKINKNYFDSYSSFGIHREMISDKVRTDAYREAIIGNPSLLKGAVVMDVGCGTGILSLFAAQAGASKVIAIEASEKMSSIAKQIAKDNNYTEVIEIAQGMVEDHIKENKIKSQSVDLLISEWMGYSLLYETMLSSVILARDTWLKPSGALLPDTATIFVAGFGKGATSIPFWESVYGFNMSCIAKEVYEDATHVPIIDVIDSQHIITTTETLQTFDLMKMKTHEMDFTSQVELTPSETTLCYGIVLWFDTGFTNRFCKESPSNLSTSPYTPKTHWSQTILTFKEPIVISSEKITNNKIAPVGTEDSPAVKVFARISIARARQHRSIDISMEVTCVGPTGRKRNLPAQLFGLN